MKAYCLEKHKKEYLQDIKHERAFLAKRNKIQNADVHDFRAFWF